MGFSLLYWCCSGVAVVKHRLCWDRQRGKKKCVPFNFCNVLIPSYQPENTKHDPLSGIWGFGELLLITAVVLSSLTGLNNILSALMFFHNVLECKEVHFMPFMAGTRCNTDLQRNLGLVTYCLYYWQPGLQMTGACCAGCRADTGWAPLSFGARVHVQGKRQWGAAGTVGLDRWGGQRRTWRRGWWKHSGVLVGLMVRAKSLGSGRASQEVAI